jgi:dienelactone hydrolase
MHKRTKAQNHPNNSDFSFMPSNYIIRTAILVSMLMTPLLLVKGQSVPVSDQRATEIRHLDLNYSNQLPAFQTRATWLARAEQLRKQILVSAGLWPQPLKQPLNPVMFNREDRGTYTVEKVYFESYPGHYVSGNLYRPKAPSGKVPAVLCPHGHWSYGRLENTTLNSGPLRAASFASQGYVAFSWDMVGYNDSVALSHRFASGHREGDATEALWGINLLGLQLWNSIRAVDFLLTLPEVDPNKIACTGESGGGTQTFLLAAVDERIKVAAPVNMVSTLMQGGSLCENAPNLRIGTNNVEIAALMAPRPMLMVSATGDWTRNTLQVEYPAVRQIYQLFGAEDQLHAVQINAPHNYNQESREAVYGWFAHWLQGRAETTPIKERGVSVSPLPELLVFFGRPRPANELAEEKFITSRMAAAQQQLAAAQPSSAAALAEFRQQFGVVYEKALLAEYPAYNELSVSKSNQPNGSEVIELSRKSANDRVRLTIFHPSGNQARSSERATVMLVAPPSQAVQPLIEALVKANLRVISAEVFQGFTNQAELNRIKFFTTYNRTLAANRVQDILTALAYVRHNQAAGTQQLTVVGLGEAGLWTLLARGLAPRIERTIIDAHQFPSASDAAFVKSLPVPGLRRAGDFTTAVTLAPLSPLIIHNTGQLFNTDSLAGVYRRLGREEDFRAHVDAFSTTALVALVQGK